MFMMKRISNSGPLSVKWSDLLEAVGYSISIFYHKNVDLI